MTTHLATTKEATMAYIYDHASEDMANVDLARLPSDRLAALLMDAAQHGDLGMVSTIVSILADQ